MNCSLEARTFVRRYVISACLVFAILPAAHAQEQNFSAANLSIVRPLIPKSPSQNLKTTASGFFVNGGGDVLTARHAVDDCTHLFLVKDGNVESATVVARDPDADLAVVRGTMRPYLSATLAAANQGSSSAKMIFSAAYDELQHVSPDQIANGMTTVGTEQDGFAISMFSGAHPGASGSPVLTADGLVIGLIVQRRSAGSNAAAESVVLAVPVERIKAFLRHANIPFEESDQHQLSPFQPTAPRANSISAGIVCG